MILITIDNNKDFMRIKMNRSRTMSLAKRAKKSWLFGRRKKNTPLIPSVMR